MAMPFPPANVKVLSVGELTRSLKELVEQTFACVWVEGEVSNLKRHTSGHVYLTLKDEEAPICAVSVRGYFDPQRKKKLPRIPRRVVLVTSASGSAVRDMLEVLSRRWPAVEVWVCPVPVQGEGAAERIALAI